MTGESGFSQRHTPSTLVDGKVSTIRKRTPTRARTAGTCRTASVSRSIVLSWPNAVAKAISENVLTSIASASCRTRQLAEAMEVKTFSEMAFATALGQLKTMLRDTDAVRQVPAVLARV